MGDDQASEGDNIMKEHRENLLKLIRMIMTIKREQERHNADNDSIEKSKRDTYIYEGNLLSLRELTKMFIEELNSEYMHCEKDDEIVSFIKNMSLWFSRVYDAVIENKRTLDVDIKTMKICNQLKKDYDNIYNNAETKYINQETKEWYVHHFDFGKQNTTCFTKDGVSIKNGKLAIVHDDPPVISPEYTKKIDEMYEWIKTQKENQFTEDKLIKAMNKWSEEQSRRFSK